MRELCRCVATPVSSRKLLISSDLRAGTDHWKIGAAYTFVTVRKKLAAAGCIALRAGAPPVLETTPRSPRRDARRATSYDASTENAED